MKKPKSKTAKKKITITEEQKSLPLKEYVVGIDYSMTCPALCIMPVDWDGDLSQLTFHFKTDKKSLHKDLGEANNIHGYAHSEYNVEVERFNHLAVWALDKIIRIPGYAQGKKPKIFLEGYSMGSKGKVFNIGENGGILKYVLFLEDLDVTEVPPTVVKKSATGKGNADKSMMVAAFVAKFDKEKKMKNLLMTEGKKVNSPMTDCVDALFIAKFGNDYIIKERIDREKAFKEADEAAKEEPIIKE
jgi:hypothetical protein